LSPINSSPRQSAATTGLPRRSAAKAGQLSTSPPLIAAILRQNCEILSLHSLWRQRDFARNELQAVRPRAPAVESGVGVRLVTLTCCSGLSVNGLSEAVI